MRSKLYVVFPVFNTGKHFPGFLEQLDRATAFVERLGVQVVPVAIDDASTDSLTLDILASRKGTVIRHEHNSGCCVALKTALQWVKEHSTSRDLMVWLDSDGEHRPLQLTGLLPIVQGGQATLAVGQIIWQEHHMPEFDRKLQEGMGALEAEVIFGSPRRWHQHCPGLWVVSCGFLHSTSVVDLYSNYLTAFENEYGTVPRWGEDMTFMACIDACGGVVNNDTITQSHVAAPNRPASKIVDQYYRALMHVRLYPRFFGRG